MIFLVAALLSLLCGFTTVAASDDPGYGPPLDLPHATHAADPSVIRVGETYYLYPTTDSVHVECWSSTDRTTWTYEGVVWSPTPGSWNENGGTCAPDVLPYEGRYYLYYAANASIGVAVADSPTGPFVDVYDHPLVGQGYGGTRYYSIDPHVFRDDDGSLYLYCTCLAPFSSVRVARLADPATLDGGWHLLLTPEVRGWEGFLCEGEWMVKCEGLYYLMYSGNAATSPFYAIGYATSTSPLGPFTKYAGNPILSIDHRHGFFGPGHNSVVVDEDGRLWMFYHTKTEFTRGWDRRVRVNEVAFDDTGKLYVVLDDDVDDDMDDDVDDDVLDDDTATADDEAGEGDTTDDEGGEDEGEGDDVGSGCCG